MERLPDEFVELLEAACNGELTDRQFERLQQLLDTDVDLRSAYVRYMSLDADLWLGVGDGPSANSQEFPAHANSAQDDTGHVTPVQRRSSTRIRRFGVDVSVLVAGALVSASIIVGIWIFRRTPETVGPPTLQPQVAFLTRTVDAQWRSVGASGLQCGDSLTRGYRLDLVDGLAEITFGSGVRTILQGPTLLDLESDNRVSLHSGRLTGRTQPGAAGFAVRTPSTTVVDIGTEFGVYVRNGESEVVVFEGEVDVERPSEEPPDVARTLPASFRLTTGQSVRVAKNRVQTDADVALGSYVRNDQLTQLTRVVALSDDFSEQVIDPARWQGLPHAPNSSVQIKDGAIELVNRGYLATVAQFDPVRLGGIRISGKWRFQRPEGVPDDKYVNIMTIAVRANAQLSSGTHEIDSGIAFVCYTSSRSASITARGDQLQATKPRMHSSVGRERFDAYEFEVFDDGNSVSFRFWESGSPENAAHSTATVTHDTSDANQIVFYCRESQPPDLDYRAILDDVVIETGVGPCHKKIGVAD